MADNDWKESAKRLHEEYRSVFYAYKEFTDYDYLTAYIARTLFPAELKKTDFSDLDSFGPICIENHLKNCFKQLTKKDQKTIKKIHAKITELHEDSKSILLTHVYLIVSEPAVSIAVFHCRKECNTYFFDNLGRVYNGWDDFVENNRYPSCEYLAPRFGVYEKDVDNYKVFETPSATIGSKVWTALDGITALAGIGSAAGLFISAPIVVTISAIGGVTVGVYSAARSVVHLVDRAKHEQSIAPNNVESAFCYFNIGASALAAGSSVAVAATREVMQLSSSSVIAKNAVTALKVSAILARSGVVGTCVVNIIQKILNGEFKLSDLLELGMEIFFLYGTILVVSDLENLMSGVRDLTLKTLRGLNTSAFSLERNIIPVTERSLFALYDLAVCLNKMELFGIFFPQKVNVWNCSYNIVVTTRDYTLKKLDGPAFVKKIIPLFQQLWMHLKNESKDVVEFVNKFVKQLQQDQLVRYTETFRGMKSISKFQTEESLSTFHIVEPIPVGKFNHESIFGAAKSLTREHASGKVTDIMITFHSAMTSLSDKLRKSSENGYQSVLYNVEELERILSSVFDDFVVEKSTKSIDRFARCKLIDAVLKDVERLFDSVFKKVHLSINIVDMEEALEVMECISEKLMSEVFLLMEIRIADQSVQQYQLWDVIRKELDIRTVLDRVIKTYDAEGNRACISTKPQTEFCNKTKSLLRVYGKLKQKIADKVKSMDEIEKMKCFKYAYVYLKDAFLTDLRNLKKGNDDASMVNDKSPFRLTFEKYDDDINLNRVANEFIEYYTNKTFLKVEPDEFLENSFENIKVYYNVNCLKGQNSMNYYVKKASEIFKLPTKDVRFTRRDGESTFVLLHASNKFIFFYFHENSTDAFLGDLGLVNRKPVETK